MIKKNWHGLNIGGPGDTDAGSPNLLAILEVKVVFLSFIGTLRQTSEGFWNSLGMIFFEKN